MVRVGYTVMSGRVGPRHLVQDVVHAEQAGYDFAAISDDYSPWLDTSPSRVLAAPCRDRVEGFVEAVRAYADAGFDEVALVQAAVTTGRSSSTGPSAPCSPPCVSCDAVHLPRPGPTGPRPSGRACPSALR